MAFTFCPNRPQLLESKHVSCWWLRSWGRIASEASPDLSAALSLWLSLVQTVGSQRVKLEFFWWLCFKLHLLRNCRLFPFFDEVLDPAVVPSRIAVRTKKSGCLGKSSFCWEKYPIKIGFQQKNEKHCYIFLFCWGKANQKYGHFSDILNHFCWRNVGSCFPDQHGNDPWGWDVATTVQFTLGNAHFMWTLLCY